ncbi:MAG: carotenoid biosynthesis protein [Candidatus Nomurabacteria bacterium]|jgi:hypothetical protein|nr:carotenoid biosynthesis protein [Candidatus Nomurabacteria bacterium]
MQPLYNIPTEIIWPTFVPAWVIGDIVIILLSILTGIFIIKKEKRPIPLLLEIVCFTFLYAAIYENFATFVGWYGYGKSMLMIFNVPLTVPLIEALFVYAGIRFGRALKIPTWTIPLLVGMFGVLADLTLDPVSLSQVSDGIGRWSWFIGAGDANWFGAPIYNYLGWFLLCGFAATMFMLGRFWYKKSGYNKIVGYVYPPLTALGALALIVSPLSAFILWLGPFFAKGGWTEYLMLGLGFLILTILLVVWRGRMRRKLTIKDDYIILLIFGVFYLTNIIFATIGGEWKILLWTVLPFSVIHLLILGFGFSRKGLEKR